MNIYIGSTTVYFVAFCLPNIRIIAQSFTELNYFFSYKFQSLLTVLDVFGFFLFEVIYKIRKIIVGSVQFVSNELRIRKNVYVGAARFELATS